MIITITSYPNNDHVSMIPCAPGEKVSTGFDFTAVLQSGDAISVGDFTTSSDQVSIANVGIFGPAVTANIVNRLPVGQKAKITCKAFTQRSYEYTLSFWSVSESL